MSPTPDRKPLDRRPWVDTNGNRHTHVTKRNPTFGSHLDDAIPTTFRPGVEFEQDPRAYGATDSDIARLEGR